MADNNNRKISIGERKFIERGLEAFAGPGKVRGCQICKHGDENIVQVAPEKGYSSESRAVPH